MWETVAVHTSSVHSPTGSRLYYASRVQLAGPSKVIWFLPQQPPHDLYVCLHHQIIVLVDARH